jgi:hypothetical protein
VIDLRWVDAARCGDLTFAELDFWVEQGRARGLLK